MIATQSVIELLDSCRFHFSTERDIQDAIEKVLNSQSIPFEREKVATRTERFDFFLNGLVVEVKTQGSFADLLRQVHRYAQLDMVQEILVVTTKSNHRACPSEINGKPLSCFWVMQKGAF
jgi:hypothetical protein